MRRTAALMVQGTGSDVGKSVVVAGLARALTRRGLKVLPFKPQNMSTNAAVTADGGEIGRAQALQARACRATPRIAMNPVLLKPQADGTAQLVVMGRVVGTAGGREYQQLKAGLLPQVLEAFALLARDADIVLVEGAGSAAETNLREGDIANMGFAEAADLPVVLVGDIERGGVIAQLVGTHAVLPQPDRARLKGFIVNKFRGDPTLFTPALAPLAARTGMAALGIVPWHDALRDLPAEDSLSLAPSPPAPVAAGKLRIAVPLLPHIANFDDLDPLRGEPGVDLLLVPRGAPLPVCGLVLLPGSKATRADLACLYAEGWDIDIRAHVRRGGHVLGLCGGYQMLGRTVADPDGSEGPAGETPGLGLLALDTVLGRDKRLVAARGHHIASGVAVAGYEMHLGRTIGADAARPLLRLAGGDDGAVSADRRIAGCHLHGIFAGDAFRREFLARLGAAADPALVWETRVETALDAWAAHLATHLDIDQLLAIAGLR